MATNPRGPQTAEGRLRKLIRRGYFPAELPPPFTTASYASNAVQFAEKWPAAEIQKFWTAPESYSFPRYGDARRKLSIVNPINQLHVSHIISANWDNLRERLNRSEISEFKPHFSGNIIYGRAITNIDFDGVARRKTTILSNFGRYVKTDIARFYPSIYTHSIAWATLGKAHVKANLHSKEIKNHYSSLLDKAVSAGQEGQTIGIPIGPDTSRIISELIAVEVEQIAQVHIGNFKSRGVRYVDDMIFGLEESETSSAVLSGLSLALYEYQLEINAEKTDVFGLGHAHTPEWIHFVRSFSLTSNPKNQRDDLDSFFEHAIYLSDQNKKDNALLFAVKRAASFSVADSNIQHLMYWLLYCSRRSATCLSFVAEHLAALHGSVDLPDDDIRSFILQQIPTKAAAGHTHELAWLLFWAREIELSIPNGILASVTNLRSSVIALAVLDLENRQLVEGEVDFSFWQSFTDEQGLKSEMWLVAYEATRKEWWPTAPNTDFITGHAFFSDLWAENVQFYDPNVKAKRRAKVPIPATAAGQTITVAASGYPA